MFRPLFILLREKLHLNCDNCWRAGVGGVVVGGGRYSKKADHFQTICWWLSFLQKKKKASKWSYRWMLKCPFSSSFKLDSIRKGFLQFIERNLKKLNASLKNSIFIHLFMATHKIKMLLPSAKTHALLYLSHVWRVIKSSVPGGGPRGENGMHDRERCHSAGRRAAAASVHFFLTAQGAWFWDVRPSWHTLKPFSVLCSSFQGNSLTRCGPGNTCQVNYD